MSDIASLERQIAALRRGQQELLDLHNRQREANDAMFEACRITFTALRAQAAASHVVLGSVIPLLPADEQRRLLAALHIAAETSEEKDPAYAEQLQRLTDSLFPAAEPRVPGP
jgi:septation ring formation regulator EzrA